jgi:4-alpha-glucanotransferase
VAARRTTGLSAFAGNPLLISPEALVRDGLLTEQDLGDRDVGSDAVDYPEAIRYRGELLNRAFGAYRDGAGRELQEEFKAFRVRHADWLRDYAMFAALREKHDHASWLEWDPPLRCREPAALERWSAENADVVEREELIQWLFDRQWKALREYANGRGVRIIGDIPIFVALDSADVWAHPELFNLDPERQPITVSGVPPDYFSKTGQLWGNPLYRWDVLADQEYDWWIRRFRRTLEQVDIARVDHFRGFAAFWAVPAGEETAINGRWEPGPGTAVFEATGTKLGSLPLIAEDLGLITPDVEELRDELGFPGMRVLQFAFGDSGSRNPHLPANHPRNSVAYTGTHDNDTTVGWYRSAPAADRAGVRKLLGHEPRPDELHWELIELAFQSPAHMAVVSCAGRARAWERSAHEHAGCG